MRTLAAPKRKAEYGLTPEPDDLVLLSPSGVGLAGLYVIDRIEVDGSGQPLWYFLRDTSASESIGISPHRFPPNRIVRVFKGFVPQTTDK